MQLRELLPWASWMKFFLGRYGTYAAIIYQLIIYSLYDSFKIKIFLIVKPFLSFDF
jgi:hypothetical protein